MEWVVDLFELILSGFQAVINFFANGIYELFRQMGEFLYSFLEMGFWDVCTLGVTLLSWQFETIFGVLNYSNWINDAWLALTPEAREALVFFRIPNALMILMSALSVRLAKKFIPFL
ncbi:MAG: hypothetical protein PHS86_06340 [Syntrophaceae bacterium]|nr:hypothetical protein [Syntrophaceae bacterium]